MKWLIIVALLFLSACAERRQFWKDKQNQENAAYPYDYGAGKRPT